MTGVIAVTGASGWLGKSTLEIVKASGHDMTKVVALASTKKDIVLDDGMVINAHPITAPPDLIQETEVLIHLAYLTRDKVSSVGYDKYVLTNLDLTSIALSWLANFPIKSFVTVSSGARNDQSTGAPETNIRSNPYGFLKRVDELIFEEECNRRGIAAVIARLWGATGLDMMDAEKYAIGNFVISALKNQKIEISSGHQVVRRYVDSREFMQVCIELAKLGVSANFDSGGPEIEIGQLAHEIDRQFGGNIEISRPSESNREDDLYFPKSKDFEEYARISKINLSSIQEQISNTISGQRSKL
jgi:nucleoside-diphosphate-sugar epimerase